jgi:hypothetical protein
VITPLSTLAATVAPVGTVTAVEPSTHDSGTVTGHSARLTAARRRVAETWDAFETASTEAETIAADLAAHVDGVIGDLEVTL